MLLLKMVRKIHIKECLAMNNVNIKLDRETANWLINVLDLDKHERAAVGPAYDDVIKAIQKALDNKKERW
jgi:hypothetical protein